MHSGVGGKAGLDQANENIADDINYIISLKGNGVGVSNLISIAVIVLFFAW